MDSKVINMEAIVNLLEENGVSISMVDGKITGISVENPETNFSYYITDGILKSFHLQDLKVEIYFENTAEEISFKLIRGKKMHTATMNSDYLCR